MKYLFITLLLCLIITGCDDHVIHITEGKNYLYLKEIQRVESSLPAEKKEAFRNAAFLQILYVTNNSNCIMSSVACDEFSRDLIKKSLDGRDAEDVIHEAAYTAAIMKSQTDKEQRQKRSEEEHLQASQREFLAQKAEADKVNITQLIVTPKKRSFGLLGKVKMHIQNDSNIAISKLTLRISAHEKNRVFNFWCDGSVTVEISNGLTSKEEQIIESDLIFRNKKTTPLFANAEYIYKIISLTGTTKTGSAFQFTDNENNLLSTDCPYF